MKRLILLALLALLAAACSSGPEAVFLSVEGLDELKYTPTTATAQTGADVTVTFSNEGTLEHNWLLVPGDMDPTAVTEEDALPGTNVGILPGGETATISFAAPEPGDYQYVCTVPGHAAAGMVGSFTVTP